MTAVLPKVNAGDWSGYEAEIFNEEKKSNRPGTDIEVLYSTHQACGKIIYI